MILIMIIHVFVSLNRMHTASYSEKVDTAWLTAVSNGLTINSLKKWIIFLRAHSIVEQMQIHKQNFGKLYA